MKLALDKKDSDLAAAQKQPKTKPFLQTRSLLQSERLKER